jgi:hypothetical protein
MALFLECESTESKESISQRRDWDYFVIDFEGDQRANQVASAVAQRSRKLADVDGPTLIEVAANCPTGSYYDREAESCVSCFPETLYIDTARRFSLLEMAAPSAACPSAEDSKGVSLACSVSDKRHPNFWPEYNAGCEFPAGSLKPDYMYEISTTITKGGLPLMAARTTVLTVAEDFAMPMCSIGNAEKIVLERGEEVNVQAQQFNPMQD